MLYSQVTFVRLRPFSCLWSNMNGKPEGRTTCTQLENEHINIIISSAVFGGQDYVQSPPRGIIVRMWHSGSIGLLETLVTHGTP